MGEDEARFWTTAAIVMTLPGVTRSTMMGYPCLRVEKKFFATFDRDTGDLIVKLPIDRVNQLIAEGAGRAFSPAGRRFREWVALPVSSEREWPAYLDEALAFVSSSP